MKLKFMNFAKTPGTSFAFGRQHLICCKDRQDVPTKIKLLKWREIILDNYNSNGHQIHRDICKCLGSRAVEPYAKMLSNYSKQ